MILLMNEGIATACLTFVYMCYVLRHTPIYVDSEQLERLSKLADMCPAKLIKLKLFNLICYIMSFSGTLDVYMNFVYDNGG